MIGAPRAASSKSGVAFAVSTLQRFEPRARFNDQAVPPDRIVLLERVQQKWNRFCGSNALQLLDSRARFNDQAVPPDRVVLYGSAAAMYGRPRKAPSASMP